VSADTAVPVKQLLAFMVSREADAVRAVVTANIPSGGFRSLVFLRRLRKTLDVLPVRYMIVGQGVDMVDLQDLFAEKEPILLTSITAAVLVVLGLWYGSLALPLRSIITITLTQIACFGSIVAVYEHGYLDFLHIPALAQMQHGLLFPCVPLCFVLVLGFSLDYDVFLVDRIVEFRKTGCSDKEAVERGVEKTCGIITSAGVVMACAFSGLLLSQMPLLNIIGTALVTAVLVDTLIVRAVVTPTLMALLGSSNWYPTEMPAVVNEDPKGDWEERKRTHGGLFGLVVMLVVLGISGYVGRQHHHAVPLSPSSLLERPTLQQRSPLSLDCTGTNALAPGCEDVALPAFDAAPPRAEFAGSMEAPVRPADTQVFVAADGQMRSDLRSDIRSDNAAGDDMRSDNAAAGDDGPAIAERVVGEGPN
jgi:hypothetical protein